MAMGGGSLRGVSPDVSLGAGDEKGFLSQVMMRARRAIRTDSLTATWVIDGLL
jgi:hypothetical protein